MWLHDEVWTPWYSQWIFNINAILVRAVIHNQIMQILHQCFTDKQQGFISSNLFKAPAL